ncbi:Redoxin domain protein [Ancylobacter novellus DSM 506]|jgi:peroxiredoxin|uniref:Glutathione-dependent peroxiredoxin n=1 Tax=Ancylobacter novellus (strain ATCC 8093 / DSM 506 / JCM 20403 / CCM 1077 / IAM 12100 / NBRC 12443 / NCIMB 10456) TaxID=639283 RepID=D7A7C4_ANCN5|nr:peroxiredoxin [Ancylobacter novellus]ADH90355.1 Redoxin domain protein [Ancylobacter novellus DSM 506]
MTIKVGDQLPSATFRVATADGPVPKSSEEIFKNKKVVLFAVPGAFTPTCHKNHLPSFIARADELFAKGVSVIAVTAVNDPFVLAAWEKASNAEGKILFLSDGNADFAKAIGMDFDASAAGLGTRSKRYSMLVDDGEVLILNVEDVPSKADKTNADVLLTQF